MPRKKKSEQEEETEETGEEIKEVKLKEPKKEQEPEVKPKQKLLVPLEDYIDCSVHVGTRVITPSMRKYVYRRKADGLAVIDTTKIDESIKETAKFISGFAPEDIIIVCKREAGWKAVDNFRKLFGIRTFTRSYPAGIITNPILDTFFEPKLTIIIDPWLDKNALRDSLRVNVPIVGLCDTNNNVDHLNAIIPCNNKTNKSLGLVFYALATLYAKNRNIKAKIKKDDFYVVIKREERQAKEKKEEKAVEYELQPEALQSQVQEQETQA